MRVLTAADVAAALSPRLLVEALRAAFRAEIAVPVRHHHTMPRLAEPDATLLLMPAWTGPGAARSYAGIKIVSVVPGNAARGKASVVGSYLLLDGETGETLALLDGGALTVRRTAAASALAADYLARPDARRLVMVGAGAMAPHLIEAHASVRPIEEVAVWARDPARAAALVADVEAHLPARLGRSLRLTVATDLAGAVAEADVVSAATLSTLPLVLGAWLRPGTHVDLVGGFTPSMREVDDAAIRRAEVYVDTLDGALAEAGDILQPIASGALARSAIRSDLFGLCRGVVVGRTSAEAVTLFKSVGTALEDLAAAALIYDDAAG